MSDLYSKLSQIYKNKSCWKEQLQFVGSCLNNEDTKVRAKAIWILGEMGLVYGKLVEPYVKTIADFLKSEDDLLRERALNAIGRIGRNDFLLIAPLFEELFCAIKDSCEKVRVAFIWACENIGTGFPWLFEKRMSCFLPLLYDKADKVRMEAPEIFRVIGKRKPEYVKEYLPKLKELSETDTNRVVRIHSLGVIKASGLQ